MYIKGKRTTSSHNELRPQQSQLDSLGIHVRVPLSATVLN